jgi:hypothetical protein
MVIVYNGSALAASGLAVNTAKHDIAKRVRRCMAASKGTDHAVIETRLRSIIFDTDRYM